jgi:hypothetical protein
MLDTVPRATSSTVGQLPPNERVLAGAFTVWVDLNAVWPALGASC